MCHGVADRLFGCPEEKFLGVARQSETWGKIKPRVDTPPRQRQEHP
jgi:hypothetical protein